MKKLLASCLAVVLIGVVGLGVALYFGYRAVRPALDEAAGLLQHGRELAQLSDRVQSRARFEAPATGELTEAQVQRFLSVSDRVRTALGPRWAEMRDRARTIESKARAGGRDLSLAELGSVLSGLGGVLVEARGIHVEALNTEGFSLSEYTWVRLRVAEAAGVEAVRGIDWSEAQSLIQKGAVEAGVAVPAMRLPDIPERNRELIKPYIGVLKEWMPLAVLGF